MLRNIEAERARYGLTISELAKQLNITDKTYWSWVREVTPIPSTKLSEMCKLWGCSSDYLLEISTPQNNTK